MINKLEQAVVVLHDEAMTSVQALFVSSDWHTRQPWIVNQRKVKYFDKYVYEVGTVKATFFFVGPLCLMFYKST